MTGGDSQIDWLVLTAANEAQARGYRAQLAAREADGRLARCEAWMVVPDPGDRRVGSGGSTFVVLYELAKRLWRLKPRARSIAALFKGERILVVHSGGDSRRLPAYAADGKVFAPVPRLGADGRPTTMFDLVLEDLSEIAEERKVVIAAGDVLLGIGKHRPDLSGRGMVGVAFPGTLAQGSRHGVYVAGKNGKVADFLQKPDAATARRRRAVRNGKVLIDTGVVSLDADATGRWLAACGMRMGRKKVSLGRGVLSRILNGQEMVIDWYREVLTAAGSGMEERAFVDAHVRDGGTEERKTLRMVHRTARGIAFSVAMTPPCDFLHIGSTREMVREVTGPGALAGARREAVYNSVVSEPLRISGRAVVESSRINRPVRLDGENMLVGFPGGMQLHLKEGWGLVCLPIGKRDWSCVFFHRDDDFKTPVLEDDGTPLKRVAAKMLFDGSGECSLWTARLWGVGRIDRVIERARWVMEAGDRWMEEWEDGGGKSLRELIVMVNHDRLLEQRAALAREELFEKSLERVTSGKPGPTAEVLGAVGSRRDVDRLCAALERGSREAQSHFDRARLYRMAAAVTERVPGAKPVVEGVDWRDLDRAAFACVADGVIRAKVFLPRNPARARIVAGERVRVESPVRIDLAGGWSDTPPICHEMGGEVVNMAVTLDGARPIRVMAELTHQREIRIESLDLAKRTVLTDLSAGDFSDPHDWAALPKAALALAGITPSSGTRSWDGWLERFGGGLRLTMAAGVPKGSGLGTSSILSAAILACLDRVCGKRATPASLMERTSVLEQMMSTAGGWQDQAGGITPGIKVLRTLAGPNQVPRVRTIALLRAAMAELRTRSLLLYTGRRRLARDILHGVVRRYLNQDPMVMEIVRELKATARTMVKDLERGDIDGFARGISRNWELKKAIDPGSTNATIEKMLKPLTPRLSGYELAGAGGGGFIYMVARSAKDAKALRKELTRHPPHAGARLHELDVDTKGLTVNVES